MIHFLRNISFLVGAGLLFSLPLSSQDKQELKKGWDFIKGDLGSVWEAVRSAKEGSPEAVPLWETVDLPHSFNAFDAVDPDLNYYQGPAWYRKSISVENPYKKGRILLDFEGVGQKAQVFVYLTEVGSHVGGYDAWSVDITEAVEDFLKNPESKRFGGKVPISIRVDNSRDVELIPSDMADHVVYGGIYRKLQLRYVPPVSTKYFHIHAKVDEEGREGNVALSLSFYNPQEMEKATVEVEFLDPAGTRIKKIEKEVRLWEGIRGLTSFEVNKPELWSPSNPRLYSAKVSLKTEDGTENRTYSFGFRHFEFVENGPFKLNGKRLLLRGTHRHQDGAGTGAGESEEEVLKEFRMIKDMGANFIRLGHYQQSSYILDLCDSLGLLVWEEIPWNRGGLGGDAYREQAKAMLTNMIYQHYNHPSVIMWSLGNEIDWPGDFPEYYKDSIRTFLSELNTLSHKLDPDRVTSLRRCDFCRDILDVYSPSIWAGWYSGIYTEYKAASEKQMKRVKHFFHAEWGADALKGRHAEDPYQNLAQIEVGKGVAEKLGDASLTGGKSRVSRDGDWSESYQSDLIDWYLKEQETMPWLTGTAYWIFKDFATPLRPDNPIPYVNTKGVVGRDLNPKESYYVFQSYWADDPMVHIYGHTWPVRWGEPGEKKTIKVYSNAEKVELFVNGKSYGMKHRNSQDFPAAGLSWEVALDEGRYRLEAVAHKNGSKVKDSIDFEYQTKKWEAPYQLSLDEQSLNDSISLLTAKVYDENGMLCLDAKNRVYFSVAGDGELLDNRGTNDGSREIEMYNGRAAIKIKKKKGRQVVAVTSPGLITAVVETK